MLRLEPRAEASALMGWLSPLIAAVLTLAAGMAVFLALGKNPVEGVRLFLVAPLKDLYGLGERLLKAPPRGLAVGFRANIWNIGAEGQFVLGAVGATGVALACFNANEVLSSLMLVLLSLGWVFRRHSDTGFYRSRAGLVLRAVGENPAAATAIG